MTDLYILIGLAAFTAVGAAYARRQRAVLIAENERLRDLAMGSEQKVEIEKLQDKLEADQKAGKPQEDDYRAFVAAHPELFPRANGKG
jgi:hypothetical protein